MISAMDSDPSDLDFNLVGASHTVVRGVPRQMQGQNGQYDGPRTEWSGFYPCRSHREPLSLRGIGLFYTCYAG